MNLAIYISVIVFQHVYRYILKISITFAQHEDELYMTWNTEHRQEDFFLGGRWYKNRRSSDSGSHDLVPQTQSGEIKLPPTFKSLISQNIYQATSHSAAPASCCLAGG